MVDVKRPYLKIATLITLLALTPLGYTLANQLVTVYHGVGVLKSASPYAFVGENVTYHIKVYNPSNFDLYNINLTDQLLGFSDIISFMEKNNMTGVTYTFNRTVLCSDPNPLVNTVHVEAIDSDGVYSTASTQAKTTVKYWIQIDKRGPYFAHEGEPIKYSIVVKNLADSPIANVTVRDELVGFSWRGDLSVGESNEFNLTYVVPSNAEDPLINKVTAVAKINETMICAQKTWSVDILKPKIEVEKIVVPNKLFANENVTYTITVTNTGDATLYNISLTDSIYGSAPAEIIPSSLSPGDSFTWTFNVTINKYTINIANATAFDILGMKVYDLDKARVYVKPSFTPKSLGYWKNHPEVWPVDEIAVGGINYTKQDALNILKETNAKDATSMLAAQLITAKLNRLMGALPNFCWNNKPMNIDNVISDADDFLKNHPIGSDPKGEDRETALRLKDILYAYNNSVCD